VVRLYQKHQMDFLFDSMSTNFEKVHEQYQFAKDNIDSIKKVSPMEGVGANNYIKAFVTQFFSFLKRLLYLLAAFLVFTLIFNKVRE
jgi:hypothetical protein